jgi:CubicO group peptidase (beta-lactamase class C family)
MPREPAAGRVATGGPGRTSIQDESNDGCVVIVMANVESPTATQVARQITTRSGSQAAALSSQGGTEMFPPETHRFMLFGGAAVVLGSIALMLVSLGAETGSRQGSGASLEPVAPEAAGWSSAKLEEARAFADKIGSAAVMVLYDGRVLVSWGQVTRKYRVHSIRKPFLGALLGIYAGRGKIDLDATLEQLGIDDIPLSLTQQERRATVRDLLESRSGVYHEAAAESEDMSAARPARGSHPPGTFFYYNNWDFNVPGTVFEQLTGAKIFEAFKAEIADPIGMEDFSVEDCAYAYEPSKSRHPAYNFRMSARDMARFGLLYLRKGNWNGRQIVPEQWVEESTRAYSTVNEEMGVGYGRLWNVVRPGSPFSNLLFDGQGAFYHTGVGIHTLSVLPAQKLVYVYRFDTDGDFKDPGDATIQLVAMIMNARLAK